MFSRLNILFLHGPRLGEILRQERLGCFISEHVSQMPERKSYVGGKAVAGQGAV
jgi:hypothetical protein